MKKKELRNENKTKKPIILSMPIDEDPVNNIQYLENVSMETAEKIKTILHQNKVLKILGFIEFLVIIILILFILGM